MSRTGSSTALIWTRALSLPRAGACPKSVQLKEASCCFWIGFWLCRKPFFIRFPYKQHVWFECQWWALCPIWESCNSCSRILMFSINLLAWIHENYAGTTHICFLHSFFWFVAFLKFLPLHVQVFAQCTKLIFFFCFIVLLCAWTNALKLNARRINAYSETEGIFSGCLASVRFRC